MWMQILSGRSLPFAAIIFNLKNIFIVKYIFQNETAELTWSAPSGLMTQQSEELDDWLKDDSLPEAGMSGSGELKIGM